MKKTILSLLVISLCALFTTSCNEAEKEKARLEKIAIEKSKQDSIARVDSLYQLTIPLKVNAQIEAGDGMFQALERAGVYLSTSLEIINNIKDHIEMTALRVGDKFTVTYQKKDSLVTSFEFHPHPALTQKITRDSLNGEWAYQEIKKPTIWKQRLLQGTIKKGSTLDQSLRELGIPGYMVGVINGITSCKVSLNYAQPGDTFRVVLAERFYEEKRIEGKVLYTNYISKSAGNHAAWRYDDGHPKSSYTAHYTNEGEALIHSGLRYPIDRLHISSGYGMRRHPVTGRRKLHAGVDYSAPTGTPIYAVAPGKVVQSKFTKYGGNTVAIRHADGYTSYYLHLSRRLVNPGNNVRSRQLIGKVGATGRVTGPHLHFGFKKPNGRWMNPLHKRMIATPKLKGERLKKLREQVKTTQTLLAHLDSTTSFPTAIPDSIQAVKDSVTLADSLLVNK